MMIADQRYRQRLLAGMEAALAERSYAELTIADIVRVAQVSRRDFYQHFANKEACFLALLEAHTTDLLAHIAAAIAPLPPGDARVAAGVMAYLTMMKGSTVAFRVHMIEILALGDRGVRIRRQMLQRFEALLTHELQVAGHTVDGLLITAVVGGINELVMATLEHDPRVQLAALAPTVITMLHAVMRVLAPASAGSPPAAGPVHAAGH